MAQSLNNTVRGSLAGKAYTGPIGPRGGAGSPPGGGPPNGPKIGSGGAPPDWPPKDWYAKVVKELKARAKIEQQYKIRHKIRDNKIYETEVIEKIKIKERTEAKWEKTHRLQKERAEIGVIQRKIKLEERQREKAAKAEELSKFRSGLRDRGKTAVDKDMESGLMRNLKMLEANRNLIASFMPQFQQVNQLYDMFRKMGKVEQWTKGKFGARTEDEYRSSAVTQAKGQRDKQIAEERRGIYEKGKEEGLSPQEIQKNLADFEKKLFEDYAKRQLRKEEGIDEVSITEDSVDELSVAIAESMWDAFSGKGLKGKARQKGNKSQEASSAGDTSVVSSSLCCEELRAISSDIGEIKKILKEWKKTGESSAAEKKEEDTIEKLSKTFYATGTQAAKLQIEEIKDAQQARGLKATQIGGGKAVTAQTEQKEDKKEGGEEGEEGGLLQDMLMTGIGQKVMGGIKGFGSRLLGGARGMMGRLMGGGKALLRRGVGGLLRGGGKLLGKGFNLLKGVGGGLLKRIPVIGGLIGAMTGAANTSKEDVQRISGSDVGGPTATEGMGVRGANALGGALNALTLGLAGKLGISGEGIYKGIRGGAERLAGTYEINENKRASIAQRQSSMKQWAKDVGLKGAENMTDEEIASKQAMLANIKAKGVSHDKALEAIGADASAYRNKIAVAAPVQPTDQSAKIDRVKDLMKRAKTNPQTLTAEERKYLKETAGYNVPEVKSEVAASREAAKAKEAEGKAAKEATSLGLKAESKIKIEAPPGKDNPQFDMANYKDVAGAIGATVAQVLAPLIEQLKNAGGGGGGGAAAASVAGGAAVSAGGNITSSAKAVGAKATRGGKTPIITPDMTDAEKLAQLTMAHESGGRSDAVSSGKGDAGGVSYGLYQMTSGYTDKTGKFKRGGTVGKFINKSKWADQFKGLEEGSADYTKKWKEIATGKDAEEFKKAQHQYAKEQFYDPGMAKLQEAGIDLSGRSTAVKNVLQHAFIAAGVGGGVGNIKKALGGKDISKMSDEDIMSAYYDEMQRPGEGGQGLAHWSKNSKEVQEAVKKNLARERESASSMLQQERAGGVPAGAAATAGMPAMPGGGVSAAGGSPIAAASPMGGASAAGGSPIAAASPMGGASAGGAMPSGSSAALEKYAGVLPEQMMKTKALNIGNKEGFKNVDPEMAARLTAMAEAYYAKTGKALNLTSSYRDTKKQAELYANAKDKKYVAKPGGSAHEGGFAFDIDKQGKDSPQMEELRKMGLLKEYGFYTPMAGDERNVHSVTEPWHLESAETKGMTSAQRSEYNKKKIKGYNAKEAQAAWLKRGEELKKQKAAAAAGAAGAGGGGAAAGAASKGFIKDAVAKSIAQAKVQAPAPAPAPAVQQGPVSAEGRNIDTGTYAMTSAAPAQAAPMASGSTSPAPGELGSPQSAPLPSMGSGSARASAPNRTANPEAPRRFGVESLDLGFINMISFDV